MSNGINFSNLGPAHPGQGGIESSHSLQSSSGQGPDQFVQGQPSLRPAQDSSSRWPPAGVPTPASSQRGPRDYEWGEGEKLRRWFNNKRTTAQASPSIQEVSYNSIYDRMVNNLNITYTDESIVNGGKWICGSRGSGRGQRYKLVFELQNIPGSSVVIDLSAELIKCERSVQYAFPRENNKTDIQKEFLSTDSHTQNTLQNIHQLITAIYIAGQLEKNQPKESQIKYEFPAQNPVEGHTTNDTMVKAADFRKMVPMAKRLLIRMLHYYASDKTIQNEYAQKAIEHLCVVYQPRSISVIFSNLRHVALITWGNNLNLVSPDAAAMPESRNRADYPLSLDNSYALQRVVSLRHGENQEPFNPCNSRSGSVFQSGAQTPSSSSQQHGPIIDSSLRPEEHERADEVQMQSLV